MLLPGVGWFAASVVCWEPQNLERYCLFLGLLNSTVRVRCNMGIGIHGEWRSIKHVKILRFCELLLAFVV